MVEEKSLQSKLQTLVRSLHNQYWNSSYVFYWGQSNSWNTIQTIHALIDFFNMNPMYISNPDYETEINMIFRQFLSSKMPWNQKLWRGISGSDDLCWAVLCCIDAYTLCQDNLFLNNINQLNGVRGARQLYLEVLDGYKEENEPFVYWNSQKTYIASISNELFMDASLKLYGVNKTQNYLDQAKNTYLWFFYTSNLLTKDEYGFIRGIKDGIKKDKNNEIDETIWSYNQGVILSVLCQLYTYDKDNDERDLYLVQAIQIAHFALDFLKNEDKVMSEARSLLNSDQKQFKGIFMRNLSILIRTLKRYKRHLSEADYFEQQICFNCEYVWEHCRNKQNVIGSYWDKDRENNEYCSISHTSGIMLLLAQQRIQQNLEDYNRETID